MHARSIYTCFTIVTLVGLAIVLIYQGSQAHETNTTNDVDITQYPYMVSIERQGLHHCAGAVISKRFVLTAAYCFRRPGNYSVRAGTTTVQQGGSEHAIIRTMIHSKYVSQKDFDITILEVSPSFEMSHSLRAVKLAEFGDPEPTDYVADFTSWGHTKDPTETSRSLRRVAVHVLHHTVCEVLDPTHGTVTHLTMCVSFVKGNIEKDPYVSDPGAPLVVRGAVVGVASWRLLMVAGDAPGPYGIFVSVPALRPWIDNHSDVVPAAPVQKKNHP